MNMPKIKVCGINDAEFAQRAEALGVEPGCISIKATTEEGLGFTGTLQGIAAHAVALLEKEAD